jgi:hypothetical protein
MGAVQLLLGRGLRPVFRVVGPKVFPTRSCNQRIVSGQKGEGRRIRGEAVSKLQGASELNRV